MTARTRASWSITQASDAVTALDPAWAHGDDSLSRHRIVDLLALALPI